MDGLWETTEADAARFAMCMVEAGYPVERARPDEWYILRWNGMKPEWRGDPAYWAAVHRACSLIGVEVPACAVCYSETKARTWGMDHPACPHVEEDA